MNREAAEELGTMIRKGRTEGWKRQHPASKGLTQRQLAKLVGASQPMVSRWENGTAVPSVRHLTRTIHYLELDARKCHELIMEAVGVAGAVDEAA